MPTEPLTKEELDAEMANPCYRLHVLPWERRKQVERVFAQAREANALRAELARIAREIGPPHGGLGVDTPAERLVAMSPDEAAAHWEREWAGESISAKAHEAYWLMPRVVEGYLALRARVAELEAAGTRSAEFDAVGAKLARWAEVEAELAAFAPGREALDIVRDLCARKATRDAAEAFAEGSRLIRTWKELRTLRDAYSTAKEAEKGARP